MCLSLVTQVTLCLVACVLCLIYKWSTHTSRYWKDRGIPGPTPLPLIGNVFDMFFRKGFHQSHLQYMLEYGPIVGVFQGSNPQMIVGDLDTLHHILIKDFDHFHDHRVYVDEGFTPLNKGLIQLKGDEWRSVRRKITPTFSLSKIKRMIPLIKSACEKLSDRVNRLKTKDMNVKELYGCLMMDIVANTNFGIEIDSMKNPQSIFIKHIKKFLTGGRHWLFVLMILPRLGSLLSSIGLKLFLKAPLNFFVNVTEQIVAARRSKQIIERNDFINLMISANDMNIDVNCNNTNSLTNMASSTQEKVNQSMSSKTELSTEQMDEVRSIKTALSTEEMMAQSIFFIVAGYDTTSTLLSCVSYLLAMHPEIQDKMVAHVEEILGEKKSVTYKAISEMDYLDQIIQETLRLYPPVPFSDRVCTSTWTNKELTIEKETVIHIPIWAIHRHPDIWPDPDKFNPDRFSKENKKQHHVAGWIPFGQGPRSCIGIRFALIIVKLAIVQIFRRNRAVSTEKTPNQVECKVFGQVIPKSGIRFAFEKR